MEEQLKKEVLTTCASTVLELMNSKQSSIELTKGSKGYQWAIKLYLNEEKEENLLEAMRKLKQIDIWLNGNYGGIKNE